MEGRVCATSQHRGPAQIRNLRENRLGNPQIGSYSSISGPALLIRARSLSTFSSDSYATALVHAVASEPGDTVASFTLCLLSIDLLVLSECLVRQEFLTRLNPLYQQIDIYLSSSFLRVALR
jgi:hypothetical protein